MVTTGFTFGEYGVETIAHIIVHEMFHCCERYDNGGPMVPIASNQYQSNGVSNPAVDGSRCVLGEDGPYLHGYGPSKPQ
jgi:hypothetical protein